MICSSALFVQYADRNCDRVGASVRCDVRTDNATRCFRECAGAVPLLNFEESSQPGMSLGLRLYGIGLSLRRNNRSSL